MLVVGWVGALSTGPSQTPTPQQQPQNRLLWSPMEACKGFRGLLTEVSSQKYELGYHYAWFGFSFCRACDFPFRIMSHTLEVESILTLLFPSAGAAEERAASSWILVEVHFHARLEKPKHLNYQGPNIYAYPSPIFNGNGNTCLQNLFRPWQAVSGRSQPQCFCCHPS